ncbi:MAG: insulinase family protein [Rhodospirillaceae bacterium]|nr:insulinase family protein [Rhodospirillaceae bacterium]
MRVLYTLLLLVLLTVPAGATEIKRVVSPGGIEAWLVEDHKNPIITVDVTFLGGGGLDPSGKEGRARLVAGTLDEGAGDLDSSAFQKALEDNAIKLSFSARTDSFSGSLSTLTNVSDEAFRLMRLALTQARFDAEPLSRMRSQIQASIRNRWRRPNSIASRTWWRAAFPDHPYGRPRDGSIESVGRVEAEDLRAFTKAVFARDRIYVSVVGDITAQRLAKVLDEVFGGLPKTAAGDPTSDRALASASELMVVKQPVPQSVVIFGHEGIRRDDPDWYAATVLMEIMAGGFGSRLTREIREKRGLTYGVYAYLLPLKHSSLIMGGVSTQNARVAESIRLVREVWRDFAETGPTDEEVADAKTYINGSFPIRFTNSSGIAGFLTAVQRHKLGIDYIDRRAGLIDGVSTQDLKRVARRLFKADRLSFVVVGDPEGLTPTREAPASGG